MIIKIQETPYDKTFMDQCLEELEKQCYCSKLIDLQRMRKNMRADLKAGKLSSHAYQKQLREVRLKMKAIDNGVLEFIQSYISQHYHSSLGYYIERGLPMPYSTSLISEDQNRVLRQLEQDLTTSTVWFAMGIMNTFLNKCLEKKKTS